MPRAARREVHTFDDMKFVFEPDGRAKVYLKGRLFYSGWQEGRQPPGEQGGAFENHLENEFFSRTRRRRTNEA